MATNMRIMFMLCTCGNACYSFSYGNGGTDIATALQHANLHYFSPDNGAREGVKKVIVLITDGTSSGTTDVAKVSY